MYWFEFDIIQAIKGILKKKKADEANWWSKGEWMGEHHFCGNRPAITSFLEKVKKSKNPATLYFEAFDHLLEAEYFPELEGEDYDKEGKLINRLLLHEQYRGLIELGILMNEKLDPLSIKNEQGQNPFEYFYYQSRKKRISTPLNKMDLMGRAVIAEDIRNIFNNYLLKDVRERIKKQIAISLPPHPKFPGYDLTEKERERRHKEYDIALEKWEENVDALHKKLYVQNQAEFDKILPLKKAINLWENARKLASKKEDEVRVTFMNLLKMTKRHPHGAVSPEQLEKLVQEKIKQEKALEEKEERNFRKRKKTYSLNGEHRRRPSPWEEKRFQHQMLGRYVPEREMFPQFPKTRKQAVTDFLLSLQDLTKMELEHKSLLTPRRLRAYRHALYPVKKFERTR